MHNTNVKLPSAPTVRPIIEINKFNVGHDLANLNTRNYEQNDKTHTLCLWEEKLVFQLDMVKMSSRFAHPDAISIESSAHHHHHIETP